jgi:hypothetical protein
VLRFIQLTYLLILKEHCWVARKSVIKFRISADARFVVSCDSSSRSSMQLNFDVCMACIADGNTRLKLP